MADTTEEPEQEYVQLKLPSRGDDEEGTVILLPADMADKFIGNCELNVTEGASGSKVIELTTGMLDEDGNFMSYTNQPTEPPRKRRAPNPKRKLNGANAGNNNNSQKQISYNSQGNGDGVQLSRVISDELGKKLMFWRFVESLTMHEIMNRINEDVSVENKPAKRTIYNFYEKLTGGTGGVGSRGRAAPGQEMSNVEAMQAIGRSQPYFQMQQEAQKEKDRTAQHKIVNKQRSFITDDMGRKLFYWRFVENIPMKEIMVRVEQDPLFEDSRPKRRTVYQWFERVTGRQNPMAPRKKAGGKNGGGGEAAERPPLPYATKLESKQIVHEANMDERFNELDANELARAVVNVAANQKRNIDQLEKENRSLKSTLIKLQHIFSTEYETLEKQGIALPVLNRMLDSGYSNTKKQRSKKQKTDNNDVSKMDPDESQEFPIDADDDEDDDDLYNGGNTLEVGEGEDGGDDLHFALED